MGAGQPERLEKIADYVIANHHRKTHNRTFTAMMCVSNVKTLIKYYDLLKAKKEAGEHKLKIATIFSYGTNEDDADASGFMSFNDDELLGNDAEPAAETSHTRDKLEEYIADYNEVHNTKYTTKDGLL